MLFCTAGAAANVKGCEAVEVSCAGEVGVGDKALAVGGEERGEIRG